MSKKRITAKMIEINLANYFDYRQNKAIKI